MADRLILPSDAAGVLASDPEALEQALAAEAAQSIPPDPSNLANVILVQATAILRDPPEGWEVPRVTRRRYEREVRHRGLLPELLAYEREFQPAKDEMVDLASSPTPVVPGHDAFPFEEGDDE